MKLLLFRVKHSAPKVCCAVCYSKVCVVWCFWYVTFRTPTHHLSRAASASLNVTEQWRNLHSERSAGATKEQSEAGIIKQTRRRALSLTCASTRPRAHTDLYQHTTAAINPTIPMTHEATIAAETRTMAGVAWISWITWNVTLSGWQGGFRRIRRKPQSVHAR